MKELAMKTSKNESISKVREREAKRAICIPEVKVCRIDRRKRCEIQVEQLPNGNTLTASEARFSMKIDIVFCCDTTSGMGVYLSSTID